MVDLTRGHNIMIQKWLIEYPLYTGNCSPEKWKEIVDKFRKDLKEYWKSQGKIVDW